MPASVPAALAAVLAVVLTAGLVALLPAKPAAAHAELEEATPADGTTLARPPQNVTLTFSDPVTAPAFLRLRAPGRIEQTSSQVRVRGATISRRLAGPAGFGRYVVSYRVTSVDGHPVTGTLRFRVTAGAEDADLEPTAADGADGAGVLLVLAALVALGLAALAVGGHRALRQPPADDASTIDRRHGSCG